MVKNGEKWWTFYGESGWEIGKFHHFSPWPPSRVQVAGGFEMLDRLGYHNVIFSKRVIVITNYKWIKIKIIAWASNVANLIPQIWPVPSIAWHGNLNTFYRIIFEKIQVQHNTYWLLNIISLLLNLLEIKLSMISVTSNDIDATNAKNS